MKILKSFEEFQKNGSGWFLEAVLFLEIKIAKYRPLDATSYIKLPKKLLLSHAIINVKNQDQKCFLWSVLAALHPQAQDAQRVSKYEQFKSELKLKELNFPFPLSQVSKFEKMNNISINVYGYEKQIFPLHITKLKCDKHVDLLLISKGENNHYCYIKSLSRLLSSLTKHDGKAYYCVYCLHRFCLKKNLEDHIKICQEHGAQKIALPKEEDKWMKFTNYHFQLKVPYVIYADFETFNVKIDTCQPSMKTSFTMQKTQHEPSGFCYIVVGPEGKSQKPIVYRGPDVVHNFLTGLLEEEEKIILARQINIPMSFTAEDEEKYNTATQCHICRKTLLGDKVRDHDHMNGQFRGAAHNTCNRNFRYTNKVPVVIHNLKGFDSHLIMQGIGKFKNKNITVIPNNMEKYISFSVGNLNFIDSFQFMNTSLDKLVNNLPEEDFYISKTHIPEEKVHLLLRKGVFPYSYMDGPEKFTETCLPPKEAFTNDLTGEKVSEPDYLHAQNVWATFNLQLLGEYHDLYMQSDVLLLADVFENYRKMCLNFYKIDPCHTYTAPGLAWHACLKMTGVELELLTDVDMYLFIERGIRGGISMITNRYGEANNKYMKNYNPTEPTKYVTYLDANNLYGWAMIKKMPIRGFKWLTEREIECLDVTTIDEESDTGYMLEVDLEYPQHLHDSHNDYPLAPEKMKIKKEMLSPYVKNLITANSNFINMVESMKLVPNLYDKKNYVVHSTNLKMYLKYGLKLLHIHRGISFIQEAWLQPYIEFNTVQRAKAKNAFEKDNFKLLNNAVFGKTMENLRNRINVKLITSTKKLRKLIASPSFKTFQIFNKDLVAVNMKKVSLKLNRPIYAGFTILELSKTLMYNFHYEYVKPKYGDRAKLLFTDTDSLAYEIQTEDFYEDMTENPELFDTSDYPKEHPLYSEINKKVIGKFKDEMNSKIIKEFVGLRAKMYSFVTDNMEKKTAKGISKYAVKKILTHQDYKKCLFHKVYYKTSMTFIRQSHHQLHTEYVNKTSLTPYDDKRYILNNGCHSFAYGHYKTTI